MDKNLENAKDGTMEYRLTLFLILLMMLLGCSPAAEPAAPLPLVANPEAAVEPTTLPPATNTPAPTATVDPTSTPAPTVTASPTVTPTEIPTEEPTPQAENVIDLAWLPFGFGSYGEPILAVAQGEITTLPEPAPPIEAFFDFHSSGRIIYGATFWEAAVNEIDSVTDLWEATLQRGADGEGEWQTRQLLAENVGRAAYNPDPDQGLAAGYPIAIARHNGNSFDLVLLFGSGSELTIAEDIEPYFSWSPKSGRLAFVQADQIGVYDTREDELFLYKINLNDEGSGWVGDAPVWDVARKVIFYPADPVLIIPLPDSTLDRAQPFVPRLLDDEPLNDIRPTQMLWSSELDQLIVQQEDITLDVQIYLFTSDLEYIEDNYFLEGATLVGWYEEGESIVILDEEGEPRIWHLETYEFVED
ncbi:MAG: hypothetical protein QNJ45_25895 [Ardenticatenaceae bacterium]|nr:hypothetical protein [Ardenticatenaceae bacterium]